MATLDQIAAQIRFQLEQLSERNGHHEFEHLCRWYARKRICPNILPATGPVSALGDQGRDFETFRTYLSQSNIANSSFIGSAPKGPIAFACTLTQRKGIKAKIKSDIKTIMQSGTSVIDIQYFCTTGIPSGLRHELQEWAKKEKNVLLEIHDGQAISENLTDQDIFWIAVQFLNIPAELYPTPAINDGEQWYFKLLETWKQTENHPNNYADFSEIKSAIRHATFTDSARKDLPFWIGQMESLINSTPFDVLKRKATYEIVVASLRGLGSMNGYEERLQTYFDGIPTLNDPSDIDDAATLCTYCVGAYQHNAIQVTVEDLNKWHTSIANKLESELQTSPQIGKKCLLLDTCGRFYLSVILRQPESFTTNKTMESWLELAALVDAAHLFPLENFADRLTQFLELPGIGSHLENHKDFPKLTKQIDELLAKRHGGFVAAEKCRDRAMVFYRKDDVLRAIKEIHRAKVQWFAKETLKGSLLASIIVASCYQKLGLTFAAKYYALATAFIAIHNSGHHIDALIPSALNMAANCDYSIGAFCGFFDLTDSYLRSLDLFSVSVDDTDPNNEFSKSLFYTSIIHALAKHLNPNLLQFVDNRIRNWQGLEEYFEELIPEAEKAWEKKNLSEIWTALEEQTYYRPFSDLGYFRSVEFYALGVTWRFKWENFYELTSIAEEIVAVVQILLADIADTDWFLLRTTVEVEIGYGKNNELQQLPSNELGQWRLTLSSNQTNEDSEQIALSLATTLLEHASLLPDEQYLINIESAFQEGLTHKIFFGQRYSTLYKEFITKERFESSNRASFSIPESNRPFKSVLHNQLSWHGGLIPKYSEEETKQVLKKRYENSVCPVQHTLRRLVQQKSFLNIVDSLRAQNWLDWHILTAVSLIVLNYRVNKEVSVHANQEQFQKRFMELMNQPEDVNADDVPISEFTEENLRLMLWTSMQSTLKNLGFELHQVTPNFEAIGDFLGERYKYWTDDIDHPNYGF